MSELPGRTPVTPSSRVRVRRKPKRGAYERAAIDAILDAAYVGHVGWVRDGEPVVTPTLVWRMDDRLYWHGSAASRMLRATGGGARVCITVTLVDGLVLARSGFNHSVNYRSVMVFGEAHLVEDAAEQARVLDAFIEHLYPGRSETLRPMTRQEAKATSVLWVAIDEASAKVRDDLAIDEPDDVTWPAWAGVIPVREVRGVPRPDASTPADLPVPVVRLPPARD